jgi:CubicO group peptidase (beta-lactamase class C family)
MTIKKIMKSVKEILCCCFQKKHYHRRHLCIFIISLLIALSWLPGLTCAHFKHDVQDISRLLEKVRKEQGLPAIAAIVVNRDKIVAQGVAGVRKLGRSEQARINDRWHLGSNTKSITATMIGILVERGNLSWDTTIAQALPELAHIMRPEYRSVTLEMLLANRGGIRHEWDVPGLWDILWKREGTAVEEREKMTKIMLSQPPRVKPGQYFYSNAGFGIAGHMAEVIMGKPWEQLIRELIFEPLGMDSGGFGVPWEGEPPTDPWPHKENGEPVPPGKWADNPPSIGPGATIHASIIDWAKYIIEHLKGSQGLNTRLLKADTYRRLHKGQRIDGSNDEYALGWMVVYRPWAKGKRLGDKGRCLHHAGSNNSWYALAWIAPERNFAVIATTNMGGHGIFTKIDAVIWAVIQDHIRRLR